VEVAAVGLVRDNLIQQLELVVGKGWLVSEDELIEPYLIAVKCN